MIFWAVISLIVQFFLLIAIYYDFPKDDTLIAVYLSVITTAILIIKGLQKTREHRVEKLESHIRMLLGEIEELRERLGSKSEEE